MTGPFEFRTYPAPGEVCVEQGWIVDSLAVDAGGDPCLGDRAVHDKPVADPPDPVPDMAPLGIDDWTSLALRARDGDRAATEAFIRAAQPTVIDLCRHLGDPDNAEDLAQEVFVRALRSLPRFRNDGSARAWLLRIARNTCADAVRSKTRWRKRLSPSELPDTAVPDRTGVVDNDLLLAQLAPERREVMALTQLAGLSYADTADILGVPIGTVRSRVARARADLLALLADPDADVPEAENDNSATLRRTGEQR